MMLYNLPAVTLTYFRLVQKTGHRRLESTHAYNRASLQTIARDNAAIAGLGSPGQSSSGRQSSTVQPSLPATLRGDSKTTRSAAGDSPTLGRDPYPKTSLLGRFYVVKKKTKNDIFR